MIKKRSKNLKKQKKIKKNNNIQFINFFFFPNIFDNQKNHNKINIKDKILFIY